MKTAKIEITGLPAFVKFISRIARIAKATPDVYTGEMLRDALADLGRKPAGPDPAGYVYHAPGNYGGKPSTVAERREAFENAPACHHDHGAMAREAEAWLAGQSEQDVERWVNGES